MQAGPLPAALHAVFSFNPHVVLSVRPDGACALAAATMNSHGLLAALSLSGGRKLHLGSPPVLVRLSGGARSRTVPLAPTRSHLVPFGRVWSH